MITEQALTDAIRECMGESNPNANTCLKLSSYLYLRDRLYGDTPSDPPERPVSEFTELAYKIPKRELIGALEGLMEALMAIQPKLYDQTMAKLRAMAGSSGNFLRNDG